MMKRGIVIITLLISMLKVRCQLREVIDDSFMLPHHIRPSRYILTVEPDMDIKSNSSTFKGSAVIQLQVVQNTSSITLHSRMLTINEKSIRVEDELGTDSNVIKTHIDEKREFFIIVLEEELVAGRSYNLTIGDYTGLMRYDKNGWFLAKYEEEGEERFLAATDFEPSDARKTFPCFDDPSLKATFIVKIIRSEAYASLANTELESTEDLGDGRYLDTFKETMIMATYPVAFAVSQLKPTVTKERHRIFARPELIDNGEMDYSLDVAVEAMQALEEYTGINYTNTKMDIFAVPKSYFEEGAMENWGLVVFNEKHLPINNQSTDDQYQIVVTYIVHEFTHQWFGNLVTFKEWQYLWLSEGFASFFQFYIAARLRPSWRLMDTLMLQSYYTALTRDENDGKQPLNQSPRQLGQIPESYVCYNKASSIIRMMHHFLTENVFRRGLQIYLNKHKFGVTTPLELYSSLQEAIDLDNAQHLLENHTVREIMSTWDSQPVFPIVTVTRNYTTGQVTLSQESTNRLDNKTTWYIPINFAFQSDPNRNFSDTAPHTWLAEKEKLLNGNFSTEGWLVVNKQQTGYYRINYDLTNWDRIATFLSSNDYQEIHVLNRGQLLYDSFNFADKDIVPYSVPLNISKYLVRETDYVPIYTFVTYHLSYLKSMMIHSESCDVFKNYAIGLLSTAYDYLGFDPKPQDSHFDKQNRMKVVKWLCVLDHSECQNKALQKIREWNETGVLDVSPNLKTAVLCCAMKIASLEEWEFVNTKLRLETKNNNSDEYFPLTCSKNSEVRTRILTKILNGSPEFSYHAVAFTLVNSGAEGAQFLLDFVKQHPELKVAIQIQFIYEIGKSYTTIEQIDELEKLSKERNGMFDLVIQDMKNEFDWDAAKKRKQIEEWLKENFRSIEETNAVV